MVHNILQVAERKARETIKEYIRGGFQYAIINITTDGGGWIVIETNEYNRVVVYVIHADSDNENECNTLCKAIEDLTPTWAACYNEVQKENE